jgi:type II secretory pathway pseudopilin PulG
MTLLEAVVALLIVGLAAAGFLGASRTATATSITASEWAEAAALAEAALEAHALLPANARGRYAFPDGTGAERIVVSSEPWEVAGVERVTVTVLLPRHGRLSVQRLERAQ